MVENIKLKLAKLLLPKEYADLKRSMTLCEESYAKWQTKLQDIDTVVDQRVAQLLMQVDPFQLLLQQYGGAFGEDYQRPEEGLDEASRRRMMMWGYQQRDDPSFQHFIQWILDTEGNSSVRRGNPTPETILFSRAMIAAPMLMRREVKRLASNWEVILKGGDDDFDTTVAVE